MTVIAKQVRYVVDLRPKCLGKLAGYRDSGSILLLLAVTQRQFVCVYQTRLCIAKLKYSVAPRFARTLKALVHVQCVCVCAVSFPLQLAGGRG